MSVYTVKTGDTLASIAKRVMGVESAAETLRKANPGLTTPVPGTTLTVPDSALPSLTSVQSEGPEDAQLSIDGARFRFWDSVRVSRSLDSFDRLEFGAPFDPKSEELRSSLKPFTFKEAVVYVGGARLFTGVMVSVVPVDDGSSSVVSVSGYARPGVLADCTAPASAFPLEYNDTSLSDIAASLGEPFGLTVSLVGDPGPVFERVALDPGKKVGPFLADLARKRGFLMASDELGRLTFIKPDLVGAPVASLSVGNPPVLSVTPVFEPQSYYSHVTGQEPVIVGLGGSQYTVANPRLAGVVRPFTYQLDDTLEGEVKAAVEAKAGRMFANTAAYTVEVAGWLDPQGTLWSPGSKVTLTAPTAMVYQPYDFLIRSVDFSQDAKRTKASLELVIPESFIGKVPERMPWDE